MMKYQKIIFNHLVLYINRRPKLKKIIISMIGCIPCFKSQLIKMSIFIDAGYRQRQSNELMQLTPRARRIYSEFKKNTDGL